MEPELMIQFYKNVKYAASKGFCFLLLDVTIQTRIYYLSKKL